MGPVPCSGGRSKLRGSQMSNPVVLITGALTGIGRAATRWKVSQNPPALEAAPLGVRVNAVAPGPAETAMLDRLTGTTEKKAACYPAIPLKTRCEAGRDRRRYRVPRFRQSVLRHRPDNQDQRRQNRHVIARGKLMLPGIFIFRSSEPDDDHRQPPGIRKRVDSLRPTPDQRAVHMQCISSEE